MVVARVGLPSTLLGPEATGRLTHRWSCSSERASGVVWGLSVSDRTRVTGSYADQPACRCWCVRDALWVRPLLENCIVDASIFEFFQDCSMT